MSSKDQGQLSSIWLPGQPADAIVSAPSIITSLGSLRDRFEVGFNHPAAIPGTVALWDFTEESTATLFDKSDLGNDATGTSISAALYIDTPFGKAYAFPGAADFFNLNDNSVNDLTNITVEVIFRANSFGTIMRLFTQTTSPITDEWSVLITAGGGVEIYDFIDIADLHYYTTPISLNQFYHVAAQLTAGLENKLWLNGVLKGSGTLSSDHFDSFAGQTYIGSRTSPVQEPFDGDMVFMRICNRELDPSEFMHHWYMKTLTDGALGGSSVLFGEQISAFPKSKSHLVTVNWKKEEKLEWANLLINSEKASQVEIKLPSVDMTDLFLGSLPRLDDDVVSYHIFDGTLALDNDEVTTGRVKDWSGNNHHGTLVGTPLLVNKRWGQAFDLAGATKYITVPDSDQFTFGNFSIETAFRLDTLGANQTLICKEAGVSTREYRLGIQSNGDVIVYVFSTDGANFLTFTATAGVALGIHNTVGIAHIDNGDNTSTTVIVINGTVFTPAAVETGTYTGMVNLGSIVQFGRRLSGTDPIDGQIFYSRISKGARSTDELIHNSLNFYQRANGDLQDTWLT